MQAGERREALLHAAERVFADRGFDQARLEDIARATGVTKAIVYRHFPSKEELFLAVVQEACGRLEAAIDATLAVPAPAEILLSRTVRVFFDFVAEHEPAFALLASRAPGTEAAVSAADVARDRIVRSIARGFAIEQPQMAGDFSPQDWDRIVEGVVRAIVGGCEAMATWWARERPYPIEVAWLSVTMQLWLGLERLGKGEVWFPPEQRSV
jgi:AcrR family transcriptional regulator